MRSARSAGEYVLELCSWWMPSSFACEIIHDTISRVVSDVHATVE